VFTPEKREGDDRADCRGCVARVLLCLLAYTANVSSRELDIEQAINHALANNPGLESLGFSTESADLSVGVARSEFRFFVRVRLEKGGEANEYVGVRLTRKTVYGTEMSLRGLNESITDGGHQQRLILQISQPLFRFGGRLINEEPLIRARQRRLTVLRAYHEQRSALVVSVAEAYERVLRLEQQLAADEQAAQRAESLYKLTLARERLGRTTRIDTLRVRLQQGQARSRVNNTREQLGVTRRRLLELMGQGGGGDLALVPTAPFTVETTDLDSALQVALANRLDYAQAQQQYADARRGSRIARKSLLPDLSLVARYEQADEDIFPGDQLNTSRSAWTLSLVSDTNVNQRREKLQYDQSLLSQNQALASIRQTHLAIGRDVEQRLLAYRRSRTELDVLKSNFELAAARLRLARKMFRLGRIDGFSVTDAEQSYFTAQSRLLVGRSEATVNGYRLLDGLGTLVEVPTYLKPGG